MGAHTSKSSAMGGGGNNNANQEQAQNYSAIGRLQALTADSTRSEKREALESLPNGSTFYTWVESKDGTVNPEAVRRVEKGRDGQWRVDGRIVDEYAIARSVPSTGRGYHTEEPDISSRVQITGRKTYTHEGMQFQNGTYDILRQERRADGNIIRKVEQSGQIGTVGGQQYGVTKSGGQYVVTHIPTGLALGGALKSWADVAQRIQAANSQISRNRSMYEESARRFERTLRGD